MYDASWVWNDLFMEGEIRKQPLQVIGSCTQTGRIRGDQGGLSHLLSLTLEFALPVFFHMPLG